MCSPERNQHLWALGMGKSILIYSRTSIWGALLVPCQTEAQAHFPGMLSLGFLPGQASQPGERGLSFLLILIRGCFPIEF